jgi:hypothetical protein
MFRLTALVLMCALLPRWALAQDTDAPLRQDDAVVAPPLVSAPEDVEPGPTEPLAAQARREEGVPTVPRILLETLSGGAGMAVGGIAGLVGGVVATECSFFETDCTAAVVFALSGMALGATLGTWGAGSLMRGKGGFWGTLLGALLGTGAGLVALSVDQDALGPIGLLSLPAIGAVTGYELSRHAGDSDVTRFSLEAGPAPVVPSVGTTLHGGVVGGVTGRF